jgi:hypothetical protein
MIDPRHVALLATDAGGRPTHKPSWAPNDGVKRVYRIGTERPTARDAWRRQP